MASGPILLVDDDPAIREAVAAGLAQDGYRVEEATDFFSAMERIGERHYPVILTDLQMPGGPSGLDLIQAVTSRDPRALCLVMTGFASMDVAIRALKTGAYDFIQKPFRLPELEALLDRALDHALLRRQLADYQENLEARVLERVEAFKAFHEELLHLNDLLLAVQGEVEEGSRLAPFLAWLRERFSPDAVVVLLPAEDGGWEILTRTGERPWAAQGTLPSPESFTEPRDWGWRHGYPDGHLIPLRQASRCLGALFLGFTDRSAFQPDMPAFVHWRKHVEAALHGLRCCREHTEGKVRKALKGARAEAGAL